MNTLLQFAQSVTTYTTSASNEEIAAATFAALGIFAIFATIFGVIGYVINAIFLGKVFKKAGIESWVAWVPIYNSWKMLEIGGQKGYWSVLALLPVVQIASIVFLIIAFYNIGLKFGKTGGFVALAILLPFVWVIWLAVDTSVWNNALGAPSQAPEHLGGAPVATTPATPVQQ